MKSKYRLITMFSLFAVLAVGLIAIFSNSFAFFGGYSIETDLDTIDAYSEDMWQYITVVNIDSYNDIEHLSYLRRCSGLKTINIRNQVVDDLTVLNDLDTGMLTVNITGSIVDLKNINSLKINQFHISTSFVSNAKDIENLTNLTSLTIDTISNYEDLDFSKLSKLNELTLNGVHIDDFHTLFNSINSVTTLNLDGTNITNSDMNYLYSAQNIRSLSLKMTNVTNLSLLRDLPSLTRLYAPIYLDNLLFLNDLDHLEYFETYSGPELDEDIEAWNAFIQRGGVIKTIPKEKDVTEEQAQLFIEEMEALTEEYVNLHQIDNPIEYLETYLEFMNRFADLAEEYLVEESVANELYYTAFIQLQETENDSVTVDDYHMSTGIIIKNGRYEKAIIHVAKINGKYYYALAGDKHLYEAQVFNNISSFSGDKVSFIVPELCNYNGELKVIELVDYELKDNMITDIAGDTSIANFIAKLNSDFDVVITDANGQEKETGLIATGDTVSIYDNNYLLVSYTAVVKGDLTGDGTVDMGDLTKLYYYINGLISLDGAYLESGELVNNNNVDIGDLNKLYYYVLHLIDSL